MFPAAVGIHRVEVRLVELSRPGVARFLGDLLGRGLQAFLSCFVV